MYWHIGMHKCAVTDTYYADWELHLIQTSANKGILLHKRYYQDAIKAARNNCLENYIHRMRREYELRKM